jgi:hypothetical protein
VGAFIAVVVSILGYYYITYYGVPRSTHSSDLVTSSVKNLVNADYATIKETLLEHPGIYFCADDTSNYASKKGSSSAKKATSASDKSTIVLPKIYEDLHALMLSGSYKYSNFASNAVPVVFASVNCSQLLPSGKTLWSRYQLKKSIRPAIFSTAPWVGKATQASPSMLRKAESLESLFDAALTPKAVEVISSTDMWKVCGWPSTNQSKGSASSGQDSASEKPEEGAAGAMASGGSSGRGVVNKLCVVIEKGPMYSNIDDEAVVRKWIVSHSKLRFVAFSYKNRKITATPATKAAKRAAAARNNPFSMRLYVLRNKSSYIALEDLRLAESEEQEYEIPLSSTYVSNFLNSLQSDDPRFVNTAKNNEIQLIKHSIAGSPSTEPINDDPSDRLGEATRKSEERKEARKARAAKSKSNDGSSSSSSSGGSSGSGSTKDAGSAADGGREERLARARREALVRERMEAQGRSLLFDDDDDVQEGISEDGDDDEVGSSDDMGSSSGTYSEADEAGGSDEEIQIDSDEEPSDEEFIDLD